MQKVRCKFECTSVSVQKGWGDRPFLYSYELAAVYSSEESHENKAFWEATPSGSFKMDCVGPKDLFIPGKEYYIDISPAEELPKLEE